MSPNRFPFDIEQPDGKELTVTLTEEYEFLERGEDEFLERHTDRRLDLGLTLAEYEGRAPDLDPCQLPPRSFDWDRLWESR